jgi:imidazole glycerol-phosphate synthase subunit HisH
VIAVVDYGMGNRRSVEKAFAHLGSEAILTSDPDVLRRAGGLVVPGVGAFPKAMANLRASGLDTLIRDAATRGVPLLGICLGMQLLFDDSSELGGGQGLGLIPGSVRALAADGRRIPHIGWNDVRLERPSPLTADLPSGGAPFYHVHSFVAVPDSQADVIGTTEYGERFATIVGRGNVFGAQFHPEKSSRDGLALLAAFAELAGHVGAVAA